MPEWTQDEAIAYECACDDIGLLRAILTREMAEESKKAQPDRQRLEQMESEFSALFHERAALHVKDHEKIARIRSEYGARIRAWMAAERMRDAAENQQKR